MGVWEAMPGNLEISESARDAGPAALGNVLEAERLALGARDRLCQARDVASTVLAMKDRRKGPAGLAAIVK